jgi:CelD/BcsL family acetyltransferase involved in cellulose biosynthesis
VTARVVPFTDVGEALFERWRELARGAVEPNPFLQPELVLAAVRWVKGQEDVALLVVERGGELRLALPVTRIPRFRRIPMPAVATWTHAHCLLGTPLLSPRDPEDTWAEALLGLRDMAPWAVLERFASDGPVSAALAVAQVRRGLVGKALERPARPVMRRRPADTYLDSLGGTRRRKLRRLRPRLAEDVGEVECVDHDAPGEDLERVVEEFLRMEASGWKGRDGGAMACVPGHADFFREVCRDFAAAGSLQLRILRAGGNTIAYQCHLLAGSGMFGFKMTFDEKFGQYSPGVVLMLDTVAKFHANERFRLYDPCMGETRTPLHDLFPDERALADALLPLRGVLGQVAVRGTPHAAAAYRRAKQLKQTVEHGIGARSTRQS